MYPAEIVRPMKEELTTIGFEELLSPMKLNLPCPKLEQPL